MEVHILKTWSEYFEEVFLGRKTFEIRKNDRNFKVGDALFLREWDNSKDSFTGREVLKKVTYILKGGSFGLEDGFVIISIE